MCDIGPKIFVMCEIFSKISNMCEICQFFSICVIFAINVICVISIQNYCKKAFFKHYRPIKTQFSYDFAKNGPTGKQFLPRFARHRFHISDFAQIHTVVVYLF